MCGSVVAGHNLDDVFLPSVGVRDGVGGAVRQLHLQAPERTAGVRRHFPLFEKQFGNKRRGNVSKAAGGSYAEILSSPWQHV